MDIETHHASAASQRIHFWPADSAELDEVARQAGYFGFETAAFEALAEALEPAGAQAGLANCLLIDCDRAHDLAPEAQARLRQAAQCMAVIGVADRVDIQTRLTAVRMGCIGFFARPFEISSLLDTLERILSPTHAEAGKVLIVDDSPSMVAFYAATLNAAGFIAQGVTDPLKTLEALEEHQPELILLDMHMPGASGEEIAKVIRQQDAYLSVPIVFLSAENDVSRQREAMSLGGDEFLQKPIQPHHLVSAVKSRVIRYRALRALMVRDSLTGLLNHTSFKERLRNEAARARRQNKPLCAAMIDIDFFKKVNDTYGHPAGDRVIKTLARLLKQRLRGADVIGRYGGEEFAVALPHTSLEGALKALDAIRESFAAITQSAGERNFQCTLSAGVVACDETACDAESMLKAADEALYAAKHGGRNQVVAAER